MNTAPISNAANQTPMPVEEAPASSKGLLAYVTEILATREAQVNMLSGTTALALGARYSVELIETVVTNRCISYLGPYPGTFIASALKPALVSYFAPIMPYFLGVSGMIVSYIATQVVKIALRCLPSISTLSGIPSSIELLIWNELSAFLPVDWEKMLKTAYESSELTVVELDEGSTDKLEEDPYLVIEPEEDIPFLQKA